MENTNRVDVVEGTLSAEIKQTSLLLAQLAHLIRSTGSAQAFTGDLKSAGADIHRQNLSSWIEMAEVIGTDTRPASGIQNSQRSGFISRREHGTMHGCLNAFMAPAPVVTGRRSVLKRVPRIREPVVEIAHHGCGGIRGNGVHLRVGSQVQWMDLEHFTVARENRLNGATPANICSCLFGSLENEP